MRRFAVQLALQTAYHTVKHFTKHHETIIRKGSGFGEIRSDIELAADKILGDKIYNTLLEDPTPQVIYIEGRDPLIQEHAQILRAVDPLDGSLNFRRRQGSFGLPYVSVITEFGTAEPTFDQYTMAGVMDLRNRDVWFAIKGQGCMLKDEPCRVSDMARIHKEEGTVIVVDFYYPKNRDLIAHAFHDFRGYMRSPGAAGYELALVASGSVDLYISGEQKCDVLGAGYALVTEAGGVVVDFDGNDLGPVPYRFNAQIPVIAAANRDLAMEAVDRLKNAGS